MVDDAGVEYVRLVKKKQQQLCHLLAQLLLGSIMPALESFEDKSKGSPVTCLFVFQWVLTTRKQLWPT